MVASEFEYRHRFWMMALVYLAAYSLYNLNHLNILYSIVPWSRGDAQRDLLERVLYVAAALLAALGAALLTWVTAYRLPGTNTNRAAFSTGGPFRYIRNPQYWAYFLLVLTLGTFQSVLGFPVMLVGETILQLRLVAREELQFGQEYNTASSTGITRNTSHASCLRFVRVSKTTASHRDGDRPSGSRRFNGASSPLCLPSRMPSPLPQ
jgi:protein-S-isoprenylcysteine O-methyltransferase Ste14